MVARFWLRLLIVMMTAAVVVALPRLDFRKRARSARVRMMCTTPQYRVNREGYHCCDGDDVA